MPKMKIRFAVEIDVEALSDDDMRDILYDMRELSPEDVPDRLRATYVAASGTTAGSERAEGCGERWFSADDAVGLPEHLVYQIDDPKFWDEVMAGTDIYARVTGARMIGAPEVADAEADT